MAFALTDVKAYARDPESSLRDSFIQFLELTFTAANTDTALNLTTVAGNAADENHKKAVLAILQKAAKPLSALCLESPRAATASGSAHTLSFSGNNPTFTFAGGGTTPTSLNIILQYRLKSDESPVTL